MSFWLASPSSFFWIKLSHWSWTFLLCPELSGQKATGLFLSLFPELALQLHTETGSFLVSVQELDSGLHVCKAKYLHYPLSHVPWPWTLSKDVKQGVVRGVAGESPQGKKNCIAWNPLSGDMFGQPSTSHTSMRTWVLIPSAHICIRKQQDMSILLVLGNRDKGMLRAHWPAGLEKPVNSVLMEDCCMKKN